MVGSAIYGRTIGEKRDIDSELSQQSYNQYAYHSAGCCAAVLGFIVELKLFNSREYNPKSWNKTSNLKTIARVFVTYLLVLPTTSILKDSSSGFGSNFLTEFVCTFLLFAFLTQIFSLLKLVRQTGIDGEMELGNIESTNMSKIQQYEEAESEDSI